MQQNIEHGWDVSLGIAGSIYMGDDRYRRIMLYEFYISWNETIVEKYLK